MSIFDAVDDFYEEEGLPLCPLCYGPVDENDEDNTIYCAHCERPCHHTCLLAHEEMCDSGDL